MTKFALTQDDVKALSEDQKGAIFDALVTAAWADGNVTQAEMERFEQEIVKLPWGKDDAELVKMVHGSRERVTGLKDRDSVIRFIKTVADRLPSPEIREKVLYTMGVIMFTDRELNPPEKNVIAAFTEAFSIAPDRFDAIEAEVRGK
jgi:uncharacterized tellurite resistance protein B-like protein